MISVIFPPAYDNNFRANKSALWIFFLMTAVTVGRSLAHIFLADGGAQSIATIPLDSFTGEGAAAVVSVFALWGLSQLLLASIMVLVAMRYRSMIPLVLILILLEYCGRIAIGIAKPLVTESIPPGATGNLIFIALAVVSLLIFWKTAHNKDPGTG